MLSFMAWTTLCSVTKPTKFPSSVTGYLLKCFVSIILFAFSIVVSWLNLVIGELIILETFSLEFIFFEIRFFTISDSVIIPTGFLFSTTTTQPCGFDAMSFAASETFASFFNVGTSVNIILLIFAMIGIIGIVV